MTQHQQSRDVARQAQNRQEAGQLCTVLRLQLAGVTKAAGRLMSQRHVWAVQTQALTDFQVLMPIVNASEI